MQRDVRSIEMIRGSWPGWSVIGDLTISTRPQLTPDEVIEGIPNPKAVRELILAQRQG